MSSIKLSLPVFLSGVVLFGGVTASEIPSGFDGKPSFLSASEGINTEAAAIQKIRELKRDPHGDSIKEFVKGQPKEVKANQEFMLAAFEKDTDTLQYAPKSLTANKEFMMAAVKIDIGAVFVPPMAKSLKADKDFMRKLFWAAFEKDAEALKYLKGEPSSFKAAGFGDTWVTRKNLSDFVHEYALQSFN